MGSDYYSPNEVLVGTHVPRLFEGAVPIMRRADVLSQAYLALGAHGEPRDEHWIRFFKHVSDTLDNGEPVSARDRRILMEAYRQRGPAGLPKTWTRAHAACSTARDVSSRCPMSGPGC